MLDFPKHFEILRDYYELLCPNCNDIDSCSDCDGWSPEELLTQVLLRHEVCSKCGFSAATARKEKTRQDYNELVGVIGRRAGKSTIAGGFIGTYQLHRLLCLEDPAKFYQLLPGQRLELAFVASSSVQAQETVWAYFSTAYKSSPWFQRLCEKFRAVEKRSPMLHKGDCLDDGSSSHLAFKLYSASGSLELNIRVANLHSNSGTLAGPTRVFVVVDELAKFDQTTSKRSAEEVYQALKPSLRTVRSAVETLRKKEMLDVLDAHMINISTPMSSDDKIMQLLKQADGASRMFAVHRATWDVNPNITRESLEDEFVANKTLAEREYGANPPGAETPFIEDPRRSIDPNISDRQCLAIIRQSFSDHDDKGNFLGQTYVLPNSDFCLTDRTVARVCAVDPGLVTDSFALTIAHSEPLDNDVKVVIDVVAELRPTGGHEVFFPVIPNLLLFLADRLNIQTITYDRWNSAHHLQLLRTVIPNVFRQSANYGMWQAFKAALNFRRISFPSKESDNPHELNVPVTRALWELEHLQDYGNKVDHPPKRSPLSPGNDVIETIMKCFVLLTQNASKSLGGGRKAIPEGRQKARPGLVFRGGRLARLRRF